MIYNELFFDLWYCRILFDTPFSSLCTVHHWFVWINYSWLLGAFFSDGQTSCFVLLLTVRSCDVCNYWQMFQCWEPPPIAGPPPPPSHTHAQTSRSFIFNLPHRYCNSTHTHKHSRIQLHGAQPQSGRTPGPPLKGRIDLTKPIPLSFSFCYDLSQMRTHRYTLA